MELRHLRYFVAVAEEQNVTRAAARLHVAQPPLSRQIRDLEEELGAALFERSAASIRLTAAGRVFLKEARAVLARVDEAVQNLRAATAMPQSELHIGYAPSPSAGCLPRILRALEKTAPSIRVTLHDMTSDEMLAGLREKRLHAALIVQQPACRAQGLKFERLQTYRVGVVCSKEHALAASRSVALSEILPEPLAILSRKDYSDYLCWLTEVLEVKVRKLRIDQECDGALSLIAAVEAGRGLAVTGESIMSVAGSRVVFVPIKPPPAPLVVGVCYRNRLAPGSPEFRFVEAARGSV